MQRISKFFPIVAILLLSYWSIQPLFQPGFFAFHDDTQVQRVFAMDKSLSDGMFPVRWVSDFGFGYGYPLFTFYAPFAYYVGALFTTIGFDALLATKLMIGLGMLVSGVSMYLLARVFWGRLGGIISALLYVYAPYHALNLYVRGAVSELWAYGLIPLVFLGVYKTYSAIALQTKSGFNQKKKFWLWTCVTALSYACVIASHNLTTMMVTPFLLLSAILLFISIPKKNYRHFIAMLSGLLIGILLASFYWVPAIFEMGYTNVNSVVGGGSDYKDHFVCLAQLWDSPWAFGGSAPGCALDGLSFRLGKIHILLAILAVIPFVGRLKAAKKVSFTILFGIFGALSALFLLLDYSKVLWDLFPQMAYFQFPWRFLVLASFFLSFLGGAIFLLFSSTIRMFGAFILVIAIIFLNTKLFVPGERVSYYAFHYTNKQFLNWETSKLSYEYMPPDFALPKSKKELPKQLVTSVDKTTKINAVTAKTQSLQVFVTASKSTTLEFAIAYFPGWKMYIDNVQVPYTRYHQGLKLKVPAGKHIVHVVYKQTPIEIIANTLSLTGVIIMLVGIMAFRKEKTTIAKNK